MANSPTDKTSRRALIVSLIVIVLILMTFWYMLNIVLLTFLFTFIFYHLLNLIERNSQKYLHFHLPYKLNIFIVYALFILLLVYSVYRLSPVVARQLSDLIYAFNHFDLTNIAMEMTPDYANVFIERLHLNDYLSKIGQLLASCATTLTSLSLDVFLALLLSLLILLEKDQLRSFGRALEKSRIANIYSYMLGFAASFVKTFADVMKVQVLIAAINCIISALLLKIMGFDSVIGLGIMIFLLGLIPVAGVFISLVPLTIIAYNLGGISKVLGVWLMILIIHAVESYVLNPKLMSNRTKLPVCIVFIILLIGHRYLGVWGLLIGVPLFIFLLEALHVDYQNRN